jgi:amino acid transporter
LIVPYTNERLTSGTSSYDARASPFVIAIELGSIKVLPSIFNAVILISVLSVGNSAVYGASRTLCGLAQAGQAPKIFAYIDRQGRPMPAVLVSLAFGFLAFLIYAENSTTVFNWLLAISGLSSIFTWGSLCFCHIQFRRAWKYNGHTVEELPWASPTGVYGSWWGGLFCILVVIFQFYIAAFPIGEGDPDSYPDGSSRATAFFQAFLAAPVVVIFYIPYKIFLKTPFVKVSEMDITTGRLDYIPVEVLRREREEERAKPIWKRFLASIY